MVYLKYAGLLILWRLKLKARRHFGKINSSVYRTHKIKVTRCFDKCWQTDIPHPDKFSEFKLAEKI